MVWRLGTKIMRIALVNNRFYPSFGGIENSLYYMAQHLKNLGHDPIIFVGRHEKYLSSHSIVKGIDVFRYPYPLMSWFRFLTPAFHFWMAYTGWKKICENETVDAVWCRHAPVGYALHKAGFDGPIIFIPPVLINSFRRETLARLRRGFISMVIRHLLYLSNVPQITYFERAMLKSATSVVTFSKNVASQVVSQYPFASGKIVTVNPGVDVEKFSPKKPIKELQNYYGLNEHQIVFLYVGRLTPEKNLEYLIEAYAKLDSKDIVLMLVGEGYYRSFLEDKCSTLGIKTNVIFAGYQDDPSAFYDLAYFFVLPSFYEGFGQVYLEALSSGVPCIGYACKHTATSEIVRDGLNGFVVYENSPNALFKAMDRARCLETKEYREMSKNSRDMILNKYRWAKFVRRVLSIS
jgi:glycosyltransferase involved in cell wall biosynthesis